MESHAPPLQINQIFVYLRDHLLINKECRYPHYKFTSANFVKHGAKEIYTMRYQSRLRRPLMGTLPVNLTLSS